MLRDQIIKAACLLMFIGFAAGISMQIELLKPGISFLNQSIWPHLITLHIGATTISLLVICVSTIPFIRHKETLGLWGIWLGFSLVPILLGTLLQAVLKNAGTDSLLSETLYVTAIRHAVGIAVLLAALGGLSARAKMKSKTISLKFSFIFASVITVSGAALTILQASVGICLLYTSPSPRD